LPGLIEKKRMLTLVSQHVEREKGRQRGELNNKHSTLACMQAFVVLVTTAKTKK
jgi:hypothetical protein